MEKMNRNRIQCKSCSSIIESKSQHDFRRCECGKCFVDGGAGIGSRIGYKDKNDYILLNDDYEDKIKEKNEEKNEKKRN